MSSPSALSGSLPCPLNRNPSLDLRHGRAHAGTNPGHPLRIEKEQAWKGSGEATGMVSVLAEPPRWSGARPMRAMKDGLAVPIRVAVVALENHC